MRILTTAGLVAMLALPAYAGQCPADMAAVDAALQTATLSEADMAQVKELRELGETEHKAGNHQASVEALAKAKEMLGI